MADDTRDPPTASPSSGTTTSTIPQKFPKGVVLGKDGKPWSRDGRLSGLTSRRCRSCTSFADWASQTKKSTSSQRQRPSSTTASLPQAAAAVAAATAVDSPPEDCPPDVDVLGRSTWTLLHTLSASYPERPTPQNKREMTSFLSLFAKLYPCWVCAEDFQLYMEKERVRVESRDEFGKWMCEAHNEVNRKLGKAEFDCARWEERWRTGWADGRCD